MNKENRKSNCDSIFVITFMYKQEAYMLKSWRSHYLWFGEILLFMWPFLKIKMKEITLSWVADLTHTERN